MGRRFQVFESLVEETFAASAPECPWVIGHFVQVPMEHWEVLGEVADERGYYPLEAWDAVSNNEEFDVDQHMIETFMLTLIKLELELRTDIMFMLERTQHCDEPFPGTEHARMLAAVRVAIQHGAETFVSYAD